MTADESWGKQFYYGGAGNQSTTDTAHNPAWGEEDDLNTLFSLMKRICVRSGLNQVTSKAPAGYPAGAFV